MPSFSLIFLLLVVGWLSYDVHAATASIRTGGVAESIGGGSIKDTEWIDLMTVTEIAMAIPSLSKLRQIYDATEMGFKVEQSRHITVFMPNNDAIDSEQLDKILPYMSYAMIVRLFSVHIIPEVVEVAELSDGSYVHITAPGDELKMKIEHEAESTDGESLERIGEGLIRFEEDDEQKVKGLLRVELQVDRSQAVVIGDGIDNANGVGYVVNALLIPNDVREAMDEAYELWKSDKEQGEDSRKHNQDGIAEHEQTTEDARHHRDGDDGRLDAVTPDYIQETNLHHWFYGRAGGSTPEYRAHHENNDDQNIRNQMKPKGAKGVIGNNASSMNGNSDTFNKVGVIASLEDMTQLYYSF